MALRVEMARLTDAQAVLHRTAAGEISYRIRVIGAAAAVVRRSGGTVVRA